MRIQRQTRQFSTQGRKVTGPVAPPPTRGGVGNTCRQAAIQGAPVVRRLGTNSSESQLKRGLRRDDAMAGNYTERGEVAVG